MEEIKESLKIRYSKVHPLLFHRCAEKAKSLGELFDFLESLSDDFPVTWDEKTRSWIKVDVLNKHESRKIIDETT